MFCCAASTCRLSTYAVVAALAPYYGVATPYDVGHIKRRLPRLGYAEATAKSKARARYRRGAGCLLANTPPARCCASAPEPALSSHRGVSQRVRDKPAEWRAGGASSAARRTARATRAAFTPATPSAYGSSMSFRRETRAVQHASRRHASVKVP